MSTSRLAIITNSQPRVRYEGRQLKALECLDRLVLCQAQRIVGLRDAPAAILRPLPDLPPIIPQKQRLILLGLVPKDRAAAAQDLVGTERHRQVNLVNRPLCPSAAVE